jgi:hypothetical protein
VPASTLTSRGSTIRTGRPGSEGLPDDLPTMHGPRAAVEQLPFARRRRYGTVRSSKVSRGLVIIFALSTGCGAGGELDDVTLLEGVGADPDLVVGMTTLSEAAGALDLPTQQPSSLGITTEVNAGPLRLFFLSPDTGGEPVLHHIYVPHIPNPSFPQFKGKTARGVALFDPVETLRAIYGEPAAIQVMSDGHVIYYPVGVVFRATHPANITGYDGPPPTPTSMNVTAITITPPFQVLAPPQSVPGGQLQLTTAPTTTLRIPVY